MKIVDANILLTAVNVEDASGDRSRDWLRSALAGDETIGFSWLVILAFVRISTNSRVYPSPLAPAVAMEIVEYWLSQPAVRIVHPGPGHLGLWRDVILQGSLTGNIVNDAHLAALALENDASIVSLDRDFQRFSGVKVLEP